MVPEHRYEQASITLLVVGALSENPLILRQRHEVISRVLCDAAYQTASTSYT